MRLNKTKLPSIPIKFLLMTINDPIIKKKSNGKVTKSQIG